MILKEFDLNKHIESEKAYSREKGENKFARLTQLLVNDSRMDDLNKAITDHAFRNLLYEQYNIE